jgi:hypothetical protein
MSRKICCIALRQQNIASNRRHAIGKLKINPAIPSAVSGELRSVIFSGRAGAADGYALKILKRNWIKHAE